jgi:hypothetical protein
LLAVSSDQVITRGYVFSNIGTLFAWSGSAQSWSGSSVALTCGDWTGFIRNDGTACTPSAQTVLDSYASAHAVVSVTHTPILVNNTFAGGSFVAWSSANTGGCNGFPFSAYAANNDEDGDGGYALATSASCSTSAVITLTQAVTPSASPTSQTYSFWYRAPAAYVAGNPNCPNTAGSAALTFQVHGVTVATPTLTIDGNWHRVSGSMTALASGANPIVFTATLIAATGQTGTFNQRTQEWVCLKQFSSPQSLYLDNIVLSAVW